MQIANSRMTTRSVSTTSGTASSARGPRARLSAMTAIVTVVENPTSTVAASAAAAARVTPTSSGPIGSQGQATYIVTKSPDHATAIVTPPMVAIFDRRGRRRPKFSSSPAMKPMMAIASPFATRRSRAIDS